MDSFTGFHHEMPDGFPSQLRDRVFMDRLRGERPDLYARLRERFPQFMTPEMDNQTMHRDIPIHHHHGNGVGSNFPFSHFHHQQSQPMQQPGGHNAQFDGPAYHHHQQQQQQPQGYHQHYYTTQQDDGEQDQHQPRVYNIPIAVEGRDHSGTPSPTPVQQQQPEPRRQQSPQQQPPTVTSQNAGQQQQHPQAPPPPPINPHPATPPTYARNMGNGQSGRAVPIQVVKMANTTAATAPSTAAYGPQVVKVEPVNQQDSSNTTNTDDPILADPSKVIPLGYTELPKQQQQQQAAAATSAAQPMAAKQQTEAKVEPKPEPKKVEEPKQTKAAETPYDHVKEILDDLDRYKAQVDEFNGSSAEDKGYKWLDEMLTLCVLRLDCIDINGDEKLRKYRKEAINTANEVFAILENKVAKNKSPEVTGVAEVATPTPPTDSTEVKTSKKIKIKKKKEEAKKETAEPAVGEEKEKKKFFGFVKSKSSTKRKSGDGADPNNNLKGGEDGHSTTSSERTSDSTNSSTVTLQGKETPV